MSDLIPSFDQIRAAILRDQVNRLSSISITPDSDAHIRACGVANALGGLYQHQEFIIAQLFADTCSPDFVLHHARQHGLTQLPATYAVGTIAISGSPGQVCPASTLFTGPNGGAWLTLAPCVIPSGGSASVAAQGAQLGAAANAPAGTVAIMQTTVSGINSQGSIEEMLGGTDEEDIEHLRARLIDHLRRPPAGGNEHDYVVWAMAVPGVVSATPYNLARGPGTIDLVLAGQDGPVSPATIAAVYAAINAQRPAGLPDFRITAPIVILLNHVIALKVASGLPADYQPAIAAALKGWMDASPPGTGYVRSQAEALISSIDGILDRQLALPLTNIPASNGVVLEWLRLGAVTVVAL